MPQCLVASSRRRDLFINSSPMRCRKLSADVCICSISLALFSCFSLTLSVCLSVISMANRGDLFCLFAFVNNNKRGPTMCLCPWHACRIIDTSLISPRRSLLTLNSRVWDSSKYVNCIVQLSQGWWAHAFPYQPSLPRVIPQYSNYITNPPVADKKSELTLIVS